MEQIKKHKKIFLLSILIMISIIIFIAIMSSITLVWGNKKTDVTKFQKHGLSKATIEIAQNIHTPINITLYVSENLDSNYPELGIFKQNILQKLEQIQRISHGKINFNIKDPQPYSPTEYEAKNIGIRPFPDSENTYNMYFGAAFSNSEGEKYIIPYFSVQRENYNEYDISRILSKLNGINNKNLGVISFAGNIKNWQIFKKISSDYNVIFLDRTVSEIPNNIKTLLVYNPQEVNTNFIYALDQYIMRGGNLILCIDPYAETIAQKYPYIKENENKISPLLEKWGVKFNNNHIVTDYDLSQEEYQTAISAQKSPTEISLSPENMNMHKNLAQSWPKINFRSSGKLDIVPQNGIIYQPIFTTSHNAQLSNKNNKEENLSASTPRAYVLAYWLEGYFESLFEENLFAETSMASKFSPFVSGSLQPSNILIIADSDFLADETWNLTGYQKQAGVYDQISSANNADFILSAIDYMNGNKNLAKLSVNYLINDNKSIAEQIYMQTFNRYKTEYQEKEKKISLLQKDLSAFQQKLSRLETGMTLQKIQEMSEYNRRYQQLQEELKGLNYKVQKESQNTINKLIILNMLLFPIIILITSYLCVRICIYRKKQKNLRIINEKENPNI